MANEEVLGPRKTMFVLVIVVGCFAVLWPRILSPLLLGPSRDQLKPNQRDREAGCCEVIFETEVAVLELMNEVCSQAVGATGSLTPYALTECRKAVNETCGFDIAAFLKRSDNVGKTTKVLLETMKNSNSSCLKEHFGVPVWSLSTHPALNSWTTQDKLKQERPIRGMGPHPALRERGRAIPPGAPTPPSRGPVAMPPHVRVRSSPLSVYFELDIKPPPIPGMRPPLGSPGGPVPAPKTSMGFVMPIYTICIIVFFVYTLSKILFKRTSTSPYEHLTPDPQFHRRVFRDDSRTSPDKLVVTAISGLVAEVHQQMEANFAQNQQRQDVLDNHSRQFTNGSVLSSSSPVQIVTTEYREQSKEKSPQPIEKRDIALEQKELSPELRDTKLELSLDVDKSISDLNEPIVDLDETIPDVDEQIVYLNEQIPDVDEEIIELDEQIQDLVEPILSSPTSDLILNHEDTIISEEPSSDLKELIDELNQRTSDLMASTPNIEPSVIDVKETEPYKDHQLDAEPKIDNYQETKLISELTEATIDGNELDKNINTSLFESKLSDLEPVDSSQLTSEQIFEPVKESTEESSDPKHLIPEVDKLALEPIEVVTEKLESKEIKDDLTDSTIDINLNTANDNSLTSDIVNNKENIVKVTENLLNEARIVTTEELQEKPKTEKLSTPELLEEALKEEIIESNDVEDMEQENASVKVIGMEMTAHSADGGAWPRAERPRPAPAPAPQPRPHEAEEVKSIFLETEIPQQSRVLVADFEGTPASESPAPRHSPLVVSGKMTLSLIQDAPRDTPDRDLESTVDDFTTASGVTQPAAEKDDELSDEEIEEEIEIEEIEEEVEEEEEPEIEKEK